MHPAGCGCAGCRPSPSGMLPYAANLVTVALGALALVVVGRAYLRGGLKGALRAASRR